MSSDVESRFELEKEWQARRGDELSAETKACRLVATLISATTGVELSKVDAAEVRAALDELRSTSLYQRGGWAIRVRIGSDLVARLDLERST